MVKKVAPKKFSKKKSTAVTEKKKPVRKAPNNTEELIKKEVKVAVAEAVENILHKESPIENEEEEKETQQEEIQSQASTSEITSETTKEETPSEPSDAKDIHGNEVTETTLPEEEVIKPHDAKEETPSIVSLASDTTEKPEESPSTTSTSNFTLDEPTNSKKSLIIVLLVIIVILLGVGIGIYFLVPSAQTLFQKSAVTPTPAPSRIVTNTPTPTINLTQYTIQILNGSGTSGVAAQAQTQLTTAGFTVEDIGNAKNSNFTQTIIATKSKVDSAYIEKLKQALQVTYTVSSDIQTLSDKASTDVVITIGSSSAQ